ncbi:hypothetical protein ISS06_00500 [Patescibacteria group bacterium]|nr:hypothetical protein [Patescibacteria group bacterium]
MIISSKKFGKILVVMVAIFLMFNYSNLISNKNNEQTQVNSNKNNGEARLNVAGKILGENIEIGGIRITDNPGINKVLTDLDGTGTGVWKEVDEIKITQQKIDDRIINILIIFLSTCLVLYLLKDRQNNNRFKF